MKKFCVFCLFILFTLPLISQKLITTINTANQIEPYSFKYDTPTSAWIYSDFDTSSKKSTIFTREGKSKEYDFNLYYYAIFDGSGNVYSVANISVTDTTSIYYLMKNGEEITSFNYIGEGWAINNNTLYFYAKENNRAFLAAYDITSGTISKGKLYDEIYLVNYPVEYYEGEPIGEIGFTKSGEPYYLASENNEKFIVTGSAEQKHYSDIDYYSVKKDNNGELTYIAKSRGQLYMEKGNTFVVQGTKEYKEFDYIYGPVIFDNENMPVYSANDSIGEYIYRTRIMRGNEEGKSYTGNIYEYKLTPSGKIAYIASVSFTDPGKEGEVNESFLVIDGKEGPHYQSVSNMKFDKKGVPYYTVSDSKNKYFVVRDGKTISRKFDNIYDYVIDDEELNAYIGTIYGDYENKIPDKNYVYIGSDKYGPYDFISMADYNTGNYILYDKKGNFAFIAGILVNREEYYYKYRVITNNFESSDFDAVNQVKISNGKVIYTTGTLYDREMYKYKYDLYINNKKAAGDYDSIMELSLDDKTGKISFIGCKGNSFYFVEM